MDTSIELNAIYKEIACTANALTMASIYTPISCFRLPEAPPLGPQLTPILCNHHAKEQKSRGSWVAMTCGIVSIIKGIGYYQNFVCHFCCSSIPTEEITEVYKVSMENGFSFLLLSRE